MKNKVQEVNNLKEREIFIKKVLKSNSDLLFGFTGAYKKENDENILVNDKSEASFYRYVSIETGERIDIPVEYVDLFEESNYIVRFETIIIEATTIGKTKKVRKTLTLH